MTLRERWQAFTPRERGLILVAVAIALVVVVRSLPIQGLGLLSASSEDERWLEARRIRNYQKILSRRDAIARQSQELKARYQADQQRLIAGATPTQVAAELQGTISGMASAAGLNVLSSQILREEQVGPFRRVGVRLTLSGNLEGIAALLTSIETGSYDLAVTFLEINRKLGASRRPVSTRYPRPPTRTQPPPNVAPLTATLEVKTFLREPL
ncbi:MAG: hypothetical protein D6815_03480 [Candidatus Dadabacteria bacterium]|nr:MAG: hypothetical protein D6815_03480 [Candidatus Dadabacteria bacterium]